MPISASPLRYPGGKTKLYKKIQTIISHSLEKQNGIYIEPYAGGAGLALKLLYNNDIGSLILNDVDEHIYAFWEACLYHSDALCGMVADCQVNLLEWRRQKEVYKNSSAYTPVEIAFSTLFLNRCNVSGIIEGGPIGGMQQKGRYKIDARFNRVELIRKIKRINQNRDYIRFYHLDAADFLQTVVAHIDVENSFIYLDPPYVKKGYMLYHNAYTQRDHEEIAKVMAKLKQSWVMTYDKCDYILELYKNYRMESMILNYSAGRNKKGTEIMIYSSKISSELIGNDI